MSDDRKFEAWAILEIMGHVRLAGFVSEQTIAGSAFVRIDVPMCGDTPGFTRFFGASSVYSLSPVTEEVARSVAARCDTRPVSEYDIGAELRAKYRPAITDRRSESDDWTDEDEAILSDTLRDEDGSNPYEVE